MLKLFLVLAAGYGLVLVIIYLMQGRMLYLPNVPGRALTMTPADARMDYEDVSIETDDGVTLHGWFIAGRSPRSLYSPTALTTAAAPATACPTISSSRGRSRQRRRGGYPGR